MAQLNINLSREFELNLKKYMRVKGIPHKSEAIRLAIAEGLKQLEGEKRSTDFHSWMGLALPVKASVESTKDLINKAWEESGKL